MKPLRPAIYVRISDDKEGEEKGVTRQLEDCQALAARRGWPDPVVYNDNDKSAWKPNVIRHEFQRLLEDIADGAVDALIVYDSDRFYRQPRELEQFIDVCERASVTELTQVTGDVELGSTDGKLTLRIKAAVAVKESDDKSRRIKRKMLEMAEKGQVTKGGSRPFGYEKDRVTVRPEESVVVVEVRDRLLAGESLTSVCYDLNERGVRTSLGNEWDTPGLRRVMKSGRISGRREHKGEIVAKGEWPAIISPEDSDRLRVLLLDPSRRTIEQARTYLLSGMLRCGRENCGGRLISRRRADGVPRYACVRAPAKCNCGRLGILAPALEELVVEMALHRLDSPALDRALAAGDDGQAEDAHQRAIDAANVKLEELATLYASDAITVSEWMAARGPIEDRLKRGQRSLARLGGAGAVQAFVNDDGNLRERWGDLPFSRRRAVLAGIIDRITIAPAAPGSNRFDPGRVVPTWRA